MADTTCPTCNFPIVREEFDDMAPFTRCSEFCAQATDKELAEFRAATPGLYCVFPCSGCGRPLEGEWYPDKTRCLDCARKAERQELRDVLTTALPHLPPEIRARAEEALKS